MSVTPSVAAVAVTSETRAVSEQEVMTSCSETPPGTREGQEGSKTNQNNEEKVKQRIFVDYDDTEGLITNLGVVAALMLSFEVGLFFTIPSEELELGNYRYALRWNIQFRESIMSYLDSLGFDYTIRGASNYDHLVGFDIKKILLECPHLTDDDAVHGLHTTWEKRLDSVFHLTKNFDDGSVINYANALTTSFSSRIYDQGSASVFFGSLALFIGIIAYMGLCFSKSREDGTGKTLCKFNSYNMPIILFGYLSLLMGMVIFFIASCNLIGARSPSFVNFLVLRNIFLFPMLVPSIIIALILIIYGTYRTFDKNEDEIESAVKNDNYDNNNNNNNNNNSSSSSNNKNEDNN